MKTITISLKEARYLALHNQLLLGSHPDKTKKDLLGIIEKLGYIQIDTISIVERAHKHVLWTRFPGYKNELLDELIDKDKKVFEFWDHAASYLPMKHYRFTLPRKQMYAKKYSAWEKKNNKLLKYILNRIEAEGPLQSRDFEDPKKRGVWWDWKPAKEGLEYLFHTGKLVCRARKSFMKVYDTPGRFLPARVNTTMPDDEELAEHFVFKTIEANGIASVKELSYLRYHNKAAATKRINELLESGKIIPLRIESSSSELYYTTAKKLKELSSADNPEEVHILSPFDNIVIQRKRLKTLFDFDYIIECYIPAPKRKYGYFCLPVLAGDRFIARIDAKADRKTGIFTVINIFYEDKLRIRNDGPGRTLKSKIYELALFSGCKEVIYSKNI